MQEVSSESNETDVAPCPKTQAQEKSSTVETDGTTVKTLQKRIDAFTSKKEGIEVRTFEVRRKNGKVLAFCNVSTTTTAIGEPHHGLNFLKQ